MVSYLFSHLDVNGQILMTPELDLLVTEDVQVVAHYVSPETDTIQARVGVFEVYLNILQGDFYVLNSRDLTVTARYPTLEECLLWIEENAVAISATALIGIGAVIWYLRKKG